MYCHTRIVRVRETVFTEFSVHSSPAEIVSILEDLRRHGVPGVDAHPVVNGLVTMLIDTYTRARDDDGFVDPMANLVTELRLTAREARNAAEDLMSRGLPDEASCLATDGIIVFLRNAVKSAAEEEASRHTGA